MDEFEARAVKHMREAAEAIERGDIREAVYCMAQATDIVARTIQDKVARYAMHAAADHIFDAMDRI